MPRRQKKGTESTEDNDDALTLLRLQQHVLQLTTAKTALEDIQKRYTRPSYTTLPVNKTVEH